MATQGTKQIETITGKNENEKKFLDKILKNKKKPVSDRDKRIQNALKTR